MKYRQLGLMIAGMTQEQKNANVTVLLKNQGEVFGIHDVVVIWPDPSSKEGRRVGVPKVEGILDKDHPYLLLVSAGRDSETVIEQARRTFNLLDPRPMLNDEEHNLLDEAIAILDRADLLDENGDLIDEDEDSE